VKNNCVANKTRMSDPNRSVPPSLPYKNAVFLAFLLAWLGPTALVFLMLAITVVYGPTVTLPLWRQLLRDAYQECYQLYLLASPTPPPDSVEKVSLFGLTHTLSKQFAKTL